MVVLVVIVVVADSEVVVLVVFEMVVNIRDAVVVITFHNMRKENKIEDTYLQ